MKVEIYDTANLEWVDITPWIAWQGLTFSRNDIDAPNAGRDMSGVMHRGRVASKEKMSVKTRPLTNEDSARLQALLYPETIRVRVTPYPRTNAAQILNMYANNVSEAYVMPWQGGNDLKTLSFPLIEN